MEKKGRRGGGGGGGGGGPLKASNVLGQATEIKGVVADGLMRGSIKGNNKVHFYSSMEQVYRSLHPDCF